MSDYIIQLFPYMTNRNGEKWLQEKDFFRICEYHKQGMLGADSTISLFHWMDDELNQSRGFAISISS